MRNMPYLEDRLRDHTCKKVENAGGTEGLTLYKTKLGAHPEYQLYEQEAYALWINLGRALGFGEYVDEPINRNDPLSALAIRLLVGVGQVTQESANEAFRFACEAMETEARRLNVQLPWVTK